MPFLKAAWRDLILFNYEVQPDILEPYVPAGVELDLWEGRCYVSLVAFMFRDVRVLGVPVPGHVHFEEVNLRFYVKRKVGDAWRRGVVFIKEIVPRRAVAFIANTLYHEKYSTARMRHSLVDKGDTWEWHYDWSDRSGLHSVWAETGKTPIPIAEGSEAEFITEHYFGYTRRHATATYEYEVTHPRWMQLDVKAFRTDVRFEKAYGLPFSFLERQQPTSVVFTHGSAITVKGKHRIV